MNDRSAESDRAEESASNVKKIRARLWIAAFISLALAIVACFETHSIAGLALCPAFFLTAIFYGYEPSRGAARQQGPTDDTE